MKNLFGALALAAGLAFGPAAASAAVVTFSSAQTQYQIGDTVQVSMRIEGLGPEILSSYDFDLLFDPAVVQWTAVSLTDVVPALGGAADVVSSVSASPGRLDLVGYSLLDDATLAASQADAFEIALLVFTGVADGTTTITLGLDPDFERNFTGRDALSLDVSVGSLCIAVGTGTCAATDVPEPASLALAGAALGGMLIPAALRRRRERVAR